MHISARTKALAFKGTEIVPIYQTQRKIFVLKKVEFRK